MPVPPLTGILETSLYAADVPATAAFYADVLGLELVFEVDDTHRSFACGASVLHIFAPDASRESTSVPPHGADGDVHVCFTVDADYVDAWTDHLTEAGVDIEDTKSWPKGGQSIYVRDPDGNSVELATPDLWSETPRDDRLRALRPAVPVDTASSRPVETFQHETLRPVLKGINASILKLVVRYVTKYGTGFASMDRADQVRKLRNLMTQDSRLKRTLVGMAMGQFTQDEFDVYLDDESELRRRIVDLLEERVVSQVDAVALMVEKKGE